MLRIYVVIAQVKAYENWWLIEKYYLKLFEYGHSQIYDMNKPLLIDRVCETCGISFKARATAIRNGGGKFCSPACSGKSRTQKVYIEIDGKSIQICRKCRSQNAEFYNKTATCKECLKEKYKKMSLDRYYKRMKSGTQKLKSGITIGERKRLIEEQNGKCAICHNTNNGKTLFSDHNHKTGQARGALCHRCNIAISAIESPLYNKYLAYLAKWSNDA